RPPIARDGRRRCGRAPGRPRHGARARRVRRGVRARVRSGDRPWHSRRDPQRSRRHLRVPRPTRAGGAIVTLLDVRALHAGYDGAAVVRDLDLTVAEGEVVALLGPNGAGKTTALM